MNDKPFDPEKFSLPPEMLAEAQAQAKAKAKAQMSEARARRPSLGNFIMMPEGWFEQLTDNAPRSTIVLALHLLRLNWKARGRPFKLANGALTEKGVARRSKWRALRDLERRGLIQVQNGPRRSPTITVLVPVK
jgi:hypothetical protein